MVTALRLFLTRVDKSVAIAEEPETKISVDINNLYKEPKQNKIEFKLGQSNYDAEREIESQPAFLLVKRDKRQCVVFARDATGISVSGYAKFNRPNMREPSIGAVIVLREGPVGHLGWVLAYSDNKVLIEETNYVHNWRTRRLLSRDYPNIRGYIW